MERNNTLDLLKIILACMVIGQHTAFGIDISKDFAFLTRNGLFRIAVPLFFILNGYFFTRVIDTSIKPWITRTMTLYGIWMILCLPLWFNTTLLSSANIHTLFENIIFGYYHLWYVIALTGAGILLKLLRKYSDKTIGIIALILFFSGIALEYVNLLNPLHSQKMSKILNTPWLYRNALLFAFPFLTTGYLIQKQSLDKRFTSIPTWFLILGGLVLPVIESALRLHFFPKAGSTNIFAVLIVAAPMVFIGIKRLKITGFNKNLAAFSSALYFVHPLIIKLLKEMTHLHTTKLTFATIAACSVVALILIHLNKRLKVLL